MKPDEVLKVVNINQLQTNSINGKTYYNNQLTKNTRDKGVFIQIHTDGNLKLECSLHKYFNRLETGKGTNYDLFTMKQAKETAFQLLDTKGITVNELNVYRFEIGLNLIVKNDCREYLDLMQGIEIAGTEKELLINQKFKDKRERTTEFHKDKRKYYKVYDKVHEIKDKRSEPPPNLNILRIETVYRRIEKMTFEKFTSPENLKKVVDQFFNDWRRIKFKRELQAPKGTGDKKKQLCKEILRYGKNEVLNIAKERLQKRTLTEREYRTIREFIVNEWQTFRAEIVPIQSDQEKEFRKLFNEQKESVKY